MSEQLPPMSSLVAFEHAARTLSFKRSAAALHLSASALTRQIQTLEELLGCALFRRLKPGLELTDEGACYLPVARRCLEHLRQAQRALRVSRGPLRVSALQSFTERWLIPRMHELERAHPGLELEIEATLRYADFTRDAVDVAIRFGEGPYEGLHSQPLVELSTYPVCSPKLQAGEPPLREPSDLAQHTLIHVAQVPNAWDAWLEEAGVGGLTPRRVLRFDHVALALGAAEAGLGLAIATEILCQQQLAEQKLVRPFALSVTSRSTYHFVCRSESLADPRVIALRDWLVAGLSANALSQPA